MPPAFRFWNVTFQNIQVGDKIFDLNLFTISIL